MALLEKHLYVKRSTIPGAGKGLFTKIDIPKGTKIVEYKGEILTWKEVENHPDEGRNGYVFYINRNHVIDAWNYKTALARYANDANGLTRVPDLKNNCEYEIEGKKCFVVAKKNIAAGSEILAPYGPEYWQVIRYNIRLAEREKAKKLKKTLAKKSTSKKSTKKKKSAKKKTVGKKRK